MNKIDNSFSHFEGIGTLEINPEVIGKFSTMQPYNSFIRIERTSGVVDRVPIHIPKALLTKDLVNEKTVKISGVIKNRLTYDNNKPHFNLFVVVREIEIVDDETENENYCHMQAYICKKNECRKTPKGRTIADITVAVNHTKNSYSYLPIIVWDKKALWISDESRIGDMIELKGRFQSREYEKDENLYTTYEISVGVIEIIDNNGE